MFSLTNCMVPPLRLEQGSVPPRLSSRPSFKEGMATVVLVRFLFESSGLGAHPPL